LIHTEIVRRVDRFESLAEPTVDQLAIDNHSRLGPERRSLRLKSCVGACVCTVVILVSFNSIKALQDSLAGCPAA
jgi:hypothetical protein